METLNALIRYNAWANERLFATCAGVDTAALAESAGGTIGSMQETLAHLVGVEDLYLIMISGRDIERSFGSREEYFAHDFAWFARRSSELAGEYQVLLSEGDAGWLDETMRVPWFDFPMTKREGLLQALTHSAQHRSQVFSVLGERGITVPDIDYVTMAGEQQRPLPA